MKATILIPTFNHGPTLNYSVQSVLDQTVKDIEVFVVGDGVPDITREIMADFAKRDPRVRFFDNPKGPRHGEIWRHEALKQAKGEIVAYLCDDDLWFPNHLEHLLDLLAGNDCALALPICINAKGEIEQVWPGDFALKYHRNLLLGGQVGVHLSSVGHTIEFYRKLPFGWRTTPEGIPTDGYMFSQFVEFPGAKINHGSLPTSLQFPDAHRKQWPIQQRLDELEKWSALLRQQGFQSTFTNLVLKTVLHDTASLESKVAELAAYASVLEAKIDNALSTKIKKV